MAEVLKNGGYFLLFNGTVASRADPGVQGGSCEDGYVCEGDKWLIRQYLSPVEQCNQGYCCYEREEASVDNRDYNLVWPTKYPCMVVILLVWT